MQKPEDEGGGELRAGEKQMGEVNTVEQAGGKGDEEEEEVQPGGRRWATG